MFLHKISLPRFFAKSQPAYQIIEAQSMPPKAVQRVGNELRFTGSINRKNYLELIDEGRHAYELGIKQLVINLENVDEVSTPGLFALYSLLLIFDGQEPPTHLGGHAALSQMSHDLRLKEKASSVRFENAVPEVKSILTQAGF